MSPSNAPKPFRIGLLGIVFIFFLVISSVEGSMSRLLGGSLGWSIDDKFEDGNSFRRVSLKLSVAFEMHADCSYSAGSTVQCRKAGVPCSGESMCSVAEAHGVLCIAQLIAQANGSFVPKFSHGTAQCLHNLNYLQSTPAPAPTQVGTVNAFKVISIQNSSNSSSFSRRLAGADVIVGELMHTVTVSQDVTGLLAWLAPRDGLANLQTNEGLLLPQCGTVPSNRPCAINIKDTSNPPAFGFMRSSSGAPSSPAMLSPSDQYWRNFSVPMFSNSNTASWDNFRQVSPALETFISLCTVGNCALRRLINRHSPRPVLPLVVEVPVTPQAQAQPLRFLAGSGTSFLAPHAPLYFKAWDADGDRITMYSALFDDAQLSPETQQNLRAECFLAETRLLSQDGPWPLGLCSSGGQEGRACASSTDCGGALCEPTHSRCRQFFTQDDNPFNAGGSMIKFDFSFSRLSGGAFASVAAAQPAFSQHAMTTLDYPLARQQGQPPQGFPSWRDGSASVQTVFAAFPCDSGSANQPPVFVPSLSSTSTNVATEYSCTLSRPCEIPLFARDFAVDSAGQTSVQETEDEIAIEGSVGQEPTSNTSLFREDGQECVGRGALSCVYRLVTPDFVPGQGFPLSYAGQVFVRCFAAVDRHESSAAPQKRTCRSMPLCIRIRMDGASSVGGWWPQLETPVAMVDGSIDAVTDTVLVTWDMSAAAAAAVLSTHVQYAVDDDVVYRPVPATASMSGKLMSVPVSDLLVPHPKGGRFIFRIIVLTSSGRYHSLRSNSVTLFPLPPPVPGTYVPAMCEQVCLRAWEFACPCSLICACTRLFRLYLATHAFPTHACVFLSIYSYASTHSQT
jgi:hypothetical protein